MEDKFARWAAVGLAIVVILAGVGLINWQDPQRPLSYEKGTYGGNRDTALEPSTVDALRQRTDRYRNMGL